MKKRLNSYRGRLTPKQIVAGMNAAHKNAQRLLKDAEIMFKSARYPTASSLAILSIEESGKIAILRGLAIAKDVASLNKMWKAYRTHTAKNAAWILPELATRGAKSLDDLSPLFSQDSLHPYLLDQLKQVGLYTDCLGEAHWSEPSDVINEELANGIISIARILANRRPVSLKEVELWIKYMSPKDDEDYISSKESLMRWYAEMTELKLTPEGSTFEDFVKFLGTDIGTNI